MKPRLFLLAAMLVIAADTASAQTVMVFGSGSLSCGDWLQDARERGVGFLRTQDWMLGYLRGVSDATTTVLQTDPLATIDLVAMNAWLENYCRERPLESIYKATGVLAADMLKRSRK